MTARNISLAIATLVVLMIIPLMVPSTAEAQSPPPADPLQSWFPYDDGQEIAPPSFVQTQITAPPLTMTPPSVSADLRDSSGAKTAKFVANESWYLIIKPNMEGQLYIYEFYPAGYNQQGHWIAYKWPISPAGTIEIGPFAAQANEPEGEHAYSIWLKTSGNWDHKLVRWSYFRKLDLPVIDSFYVDPKNISQGQSASLTWNVTGATKVMIVPDIGEVPSASSKVVSPKGDTTYVLTATSVGGNSTREVKISVGNAEIASTGATPTKAIWEEWWFYTILGLVVLALVVVVVLAMGKSKIQPNYAEIDETIAQTPTRHSTDVPTAASAPTVARTPASAPTLTRPGGAPTMIPSKARLVLPNGSDIRLPVSLKRVGRGDFAATLSSDKADFISRYHVAISFENGVHFIEDLNSSNGTKINGIEIQGKGKQKLADGDKIEMAEAITLIFRTD